MSRIQKDEGVEEVRAHMAGYNIMALDIVAKNNPDSKFNSFKVSVNVVDADKFSDPDVWPVAVYVRNIELWLMNNYVLLDITFMILVVNLIL